MNTKATLALLAATLAPLPLYAQADAPAASVLAPQQSVTAMRAAALAPLALIPADAEAALHICLPAELTDIDEDIAVRTITVGANKGTGQALSNLHNLLLAIFQDAMSREVVKDWVTVTPGHIASIISEVAKSASKGYTDAACNAAANLHIAPVYALLTPVPGREAALQAFEEKIIADMKKSAENNDDSEFVTIGGFSGLKVTIYDPEKRNVDNTPVMDVVDAAIGIRSVYILVGKQGDCTTLLVCEDPTQAVFAPNAESSILSTDQWSAVDDKLGGNLIVAASMAPELYNGFLAGYRNFASIFKPAGEIFGKLEGTDQAHVGFFRQAAKGVDTLAQQISSLFPTATKPTFLQVWSDGASYNLDIKTDAMGGSYQPVKSALAGKAQSPDTILFVESTPFSSGSRFDLDTTILAAIHIFQGVYLTLKPELQKETDQELSAMWEFFSDAMDVPYNLRSICQGLDGHTSLVVDGKAKAPAFIARGKAADFPRIAFHTGVSDRSLISAGWDGLMQTAKNLLDKCGQDSSIIDMLPIVPAKAGEATSYTVSIPGVFTPDFCPNATISDKGLAIGTSAKLDKELVNSAPGSEEFAGTRFILRGAPLAKLIGSMAAASGNTDAEGAAILIDMYLDSISGSSTIKDGEQTLHLEIKLSNKED